MLIQKRGDFLASENWVVGNLEDALETWNEKMSEIWTIVSQSPEEFRGGAIWHIVVSINGGLKAVGYALLVLFFLVGVVKTCGNLNEIKRPEQAFRLFIRFAAAKGLISYGLDLMIAVFKIIQGVISKIISSSGFAQTGDTLLPQEMVKAIEDCGFFESIPLWAVTLIGSLLITVLSFVMILTVYGRFFKLYLYTAIAPVPLSSFAGEPTSNIGKSFLKSYAAVCLEGAVIVLACIIYTAFTSTPPQMDVDASAINMVWKYVGELIFGMLILTGTVKMADRVSHEMFGV